MAKENCARAELIVLASFSQAAMIPDLLRGDSKDMTKITRQPSQQVLTSSCKQFLCVLTTI